MFSCEICEILKNIFFCKTPPVVAFKTKHIHTLNGYLLHIRTESLDWNESYEKEIKHIHASTADLLHIRIRNLDWSKCGRCKNEAGKIDCLYCREVDAMLIALAKISEHEGTISRYSFDG